MRWFSRLFVLGLIVFVAIQFVPYGREHDNPRTVQEMRWNTPETRLLASDGCFACHSNLTHWPWYSNVAPISWLTVRDVENGRAKLNFSEWQVPQEVGLEELVRAIRDNEMPPLQYRLIHKEARLSDHQRDVLEDGLTKSWAADPPGT